MESNTGNPCIPDPYRQATVRKSASASDASSADENTAIIVPKNEDKTEWNFILVESEKLDLVGSGHHL